MAQLTARILAFTLCLAGACTPDKRPGPPAKPVDDKSKLPALGPAQQCKLEPELAGPLRRAGTATIELAGSGGKVSVKDAPALCGPMYDKDSHVLGVKAGEGLLFEVCLSEGLLQVSSFERIAGARPARSFENPSGAEVAFNEFKGGTFSMRGDAGDTITFAADFWSVDAKVHLKNELDTEELSGTVRFACPIPNPAAPKPEAVAEPEKP